MMSFKQLVEMLNHEYGTFAAVKPSASTMEEIIKWCKANNIQNPIAPNDLHCTLAFSKVPAPTLKDHIFDLPITAKITKISLFGDNHNCLVLELDSPALHAQHELIHDQYNLHYDWPDYKPHISVTYDFVGEMPTDVPTFPIVFDRAYVEPLEQPKDEK